MARTIKSAILEAERDSGYHTEPLIVCKGAGSWFVYGYNEIGFGYIDGLELNNRIRIRRKDQGFYEV